MPLFAPFLLDLCACVSSFVIFLFEFHTNVFASPVPSSHIGSEILPAPRENGLRSARDTATLINLISLDKCARSDYYLKYRLNNRNDC